MKYIIIGKGFIYQRHVDAVHDTGGEIIATCDINPDKDADFLDYRDMIDNFKNKADAVVICAPNHLHAEMARYAEHVNLPVLCEKPLTINTDFNGLDDVAVVLQLRYHPLFEEICDALNSANDIHIVLMAYRDENFWDSWKGDETKSGGVIYILGAHIFDLLIYALGTDYKIENVVDSMKKSFGTIVFNSNVRVSFNIEFLDSRKGQTRHLIIDGEKYVLSLKDNLSFEGMHHHVYNAFVSKKAPKLDEVKKSIELIDNIKRFVA